MVSLPPVTPASIQLAREAQARERAEVERLTGMRITDEGHMHTTHDETDRLFDTSSSHLAEVFGQRTKQMMREGRDVSVAARLAASFAQRAIAELPKVAGYISPSEPWGVSR